MAIVNGRRMYNSRKLAAVAKLEDRAASEYAWMMAGISDDWGRFRASARAILGEAYQDRPDVTEADIERWLVLYNEASIDGESHGLLRFYWVDGVKYAEWTNYMGDSESQRQHHNCPEPEWSTHKHSKRCRLWGDAKKKDAPRHRSKTKPKAYVSVPSVPSVPSVLTPEQTEPGERARVEVNPLVVPGTAVPECYRLVEAIRDHPQFAGAGLWPGQPPDADGSEIVVAASKWKGQSYSNPANMPQDRLTRTNLTLREWLRTLEARGSPVRRESQLQRAEREAQEERKASA